MWVYEVSRFSRQRLTTANQHKERMLGYDSVVTLKITHFLSYSAVWHMRALVLCVIHLLWAPLAYVSIRIYHPVCAARLRWCSFYLKYLKNTWAWYAHIQVQSARILNQANQNWTLRNNVTLVCQGQTNLSVFFPVKFSGQSNSSELPIIMTCELKKSQ